ncbi:uncharacterized protein UDID_07848 [Ustilago sp. UG-2017a]|nr:uncharacterized protein UDID_07848 [Ustilago sp. UG-2017a]
MLSLPKRLIFGNQTKIDFKVSQLDGIARLYSERHIPYHDSKYWSRYLELDTPSDVFSLLSLADLRRARKDAPENVVTLLRVMVAHLESLLLDPLFEAPPLKGPSTSQERMTARITGIADVSKWKLPAASMIALDSTQSTPGVQQRDRVKEALNVVRILTRTLPALMEAHDSSFEDHVLWPQTQQAYADTKPEQSFIPNQAEDRDAAASKLDTSAQFVIDDDDKDASKPSATDDHPLKPFEDEADSKADATAEEEQQAVPIALGESLVRLAVDLLFCSGFTLPWTEDQIEEAHHSNQPRRINYSIWEAGVGSSVDLPGTTRLHVSNRVEVLRLLLVLLSKSIYIPAHKQNSVIEPALSFAVQDLDRSIMLPLLCSLINTSITNARNSTPAWLGLPSVSGLVGGTNDQVRTNLVTLSLQILDVLLTYDVPSPGKADTISLSTGDRPLPGPGGRNVFRFYLSKLYRTADFDFIWTGLADSFNQHISSTIQILAIPIPIPTRGQGRRAAETSWQLGQVAERLILLWRLLEHNHKFRLYVLDDAKRAPELLTILLYFSLTYKDNIALQGLVGLCAYMLQDISSQPAFATNLARPGSAAKIHLPARLGLVAGNTAIDHLVQGVYILIATTKSRLSNLYAPLVISLSNTAPAWRSLSITASTKVVHLLRSFSQPAFLLSDEGHPRLLFYVLEAINAVLTFGYSANVNLVYSLLLASSLIDRLESFTLRRGVEHVWRRRRERGLDVSDWFEHVPRLDKLGLAPARDSLEACGTATAEGEREREREREREEAVDKGKSRRMSTSSTSLATLPNHASTRSQWESELSKYPLETIELVGGRYISKSSFRPSQAWVESWHQHLPLSTPRFVIDRLLQQVERIAAGGGVDTNTAAVEITGGNADARILAFLQQQNLSDHLPPPETDSHTRPWQWTDDAVVWLTSYLWGTIYVSALLPYALWSDTEVRLFRIHSAQEEGGGGEWFG